jgi:hypothetical protein
VGFFVNTLKVPGREKHELFGFSALESTKRTLPPFGGENYLLNK